VFQLGVSKSAIQGDLRTKVADDGSKRGRQLHTGEVVNGIDEGRTRY